MSRCPFWSTSKSSVECNSECPMIENEDSYKECIFTEQITERNITFKDIITDSVMHP